MSYALGVDLGTTYTAAAVLRDGRVEVVELGDRVASVASVLWFRNDHGLVVGEAAVRRAESDPGRVVREFKRRFGDPVPIMVAGTPISADALTARLLRWVIDVVAEQEGGEPAVVGVAHPANWGPYKLDLLAQAVRLAGVNQVRFVSEPHAAAESHATAARVPAGDVVAVYDLGGGTFDTAVLQRGDVGFELLGAEGIERLGGIDFDEAVVDHVRQALGPGLAELDRSDPVVAQALARLRDDCVLAKEALSSDTEVSIPVALPGLHTTVRLCRGEFEDMIRPIVTSTIDTLFQAITTAGLTPAQLSKVLLVGGSSRIPLVSLMISMELGCPVALDTHPKHAVAMGSAYCAGREPSPADPTRAGTVAGTAPVALTAAPVDPAAAPMDPAAAPMDPATAPQLPVVTRAPEVTRPREVAGNSDAPKDSPTLLTRRDRRQGVSRVNRLAMAALLVVTLAGLMIVLVDLYNPAVAEVFLEPADRPGPAAFTPTVANPDNPTVSPPDLGRQDGQVLGIHGDDAGLYGGADNWICRKDQLVDFLVQDDEKKAAWAGALDLPPAQIPAYVDGLTPVLLQMVTRVTNYGYDTGTAMARQSVLQAGTAVLVDRYGMPRVRCGSGTPLTDAERVVQPDFTGDSWSGFDSAGMTRVVPAQRPVDRFVLRDMHTGKASSRLAGTDGERDVESTVVVPLPITPGPTSVSGPRSTADAGPTEQPTSVNGSTSVARPTPVVGPTSLARPTPEMGPTSLLVPTAVPEPESVPQPPPESTTGRGGYAG